MSFVLNTSQSGLPPVGASTARIPCKPAPFSGLPQISDFFGSYPDPDDPVNGPYFNSYFTRKQEFCELQPALQDQVPQRGVGYPHQKLSVRFLTWYDRELLIHDPGTGKSCIITHSSELFKNEYLKDVTDKAKIDRAIILISGVALEENIRNEIVCRCTDRIYETEMVKRATDESIMRSNLTRELKTWYDIMTYHDFAKKIREFQREEDLEKFMSNKAFYIDEAHGVPKLNDIRNPKHIGTTIQGSGGETIYDTIFRAFHKGKRNKIILATATPMTNSPIDIIPLINLILPLNNQMERWKLEDEAEFASQPLEYFEKYFRGKVSYIRASDTGAIPDPQGIDPETEEGFSTKIFPAPMSQFQYYVYVNAAQGIDISQMQLIGRKKQSAFYDKVRHASNFVFPDGSYGTAGFNKYIELSQGRYQFRSTDDGRYLQLLVGNKDADKKGLKTLSSKYAEIIDICKRSFPETDIVEDDTKGVIFIYFPDYVHGSGSIMLGMCLRENGYEEFQYNRNIYISTQQGRPFGVCLDRPEEQISREAKIKPRPRFAILSNETPAALLSTILNTVNSYENRHGRFLQVIIGSRIARQGININHAVKMIMTSGGWNFSSNYQAEQRVFRSLSHIVRIREKEKYTKSTNVTMKVQTFNMAATYEVPDDLPPGSNPIFREDNFNTIDAKMFFLAEGKNRLIRKIMRYAKQCAFDGYINYERNVRATDIPGSAQCDYTDCNYQITGIRKDIIEKTDRTTKVLYYSNEEITYAQTHVRKLFSRFYSLKTDQIYQLIPEIDSIFINLAIAKMIQDNVRLLDRMGFFGYLRESPNGVIYLEKDPFEIRAHPENTVYSSVLIGTQNPYNNSFNDYITDLTFRNEEPLMDQLSKTRPDDPNFAIFLDRLSLMRKAGLLEDVLYERQTTGQTTDFHNAVIRASNHAIFELAEPTDLLAQTANKLAQRGKTRGRKPALNAQPKIKKLTQKEFTLPSFNPSITGERIILHTLFQQASHNNSNYSVINKFLKGEGRIRIFKPSEGTRWRDVIENEYLAYNNLIQRQINQIREYYEQFPIYGIMIPPENRLHIRDRENENPEDAANDARSVYDGKICNFWLKPSLVNILYRLKLEPPVQVSPNITRQMIIDYLRGMGGIDAREDPLDRFTDNRLRYYYGWYQSRSNRDDICKNLQSYFERTGRLFTGKMPQALYRQTSTVGSIMTGPALIEVSYEQPVTLANLAPTTLNVVNTTQIMVSQNQSVSVIPTVTGTHIALPPPIPQMTSGLASLNLGGMAMPQTEK